jgi:GntR family transcriptional regulator
VPIYRQIIDQIKYQIAVGALPQGEKLPGVRQLAAELTVNQNTIVKVYNQLCQEKVLQTDRGNGTYVAVSARSLPATERKQIVSRLLGEAVVQAVHFDLSVDQLHEWLDREYHTIKKLRDRSAQDE